MGGGEARHAEHGAGDQQKARAEAPEQHEEEREENIILLLDREAPGVEQRLELRRGVEISRLAPKQEIGSEGRHRDQAFGERLDILRHEIEPGERQRDEHDEKQRRQDAPRPALVEIRQAEALGLEIGDDDGGDQIAADDEKNIDPDIAAAERPEARVKQNDRNNGDSPQTIYFGTFTQTTTRVWFRRTRRSSLSVENSCAGRAGRGVILRNRC